MCVYNNKFKTKLKNTCVCPTHVLTHIWFTAFQTCLSIRPDSFFRGEVVSVWDSPGKRVHMGNKEANDPQTNTIRNAQKTSKTPWYDTKFENIQEKWTDAQPWAQIATKVARIFGIWESGCPSCENLALKAAIRPIFGQSWSKFSPKTRQKKRNGTKPPHKASPFSFSTQKRCWNPKNAFQKMFLDVKKCKSLLP